MTYQETMEKALTVRWKVSPCNIGKDCWCRMIEPEEKIEYDGDDEIYIAHSGTITKAHAEYIVNLHNNSL